MIVSMQDFLSRLETMRRSMNCIEENFTGPTVIMTSMPADPIHPGHISCLQNMISSCMIKSSKNIIDPVTVCVVNGPEFLKLKKGFEFIPWNDRCEIIDSIDNGPAYVVPFEPSDLSDLTVCEAIKLIKPEYFCKGGDRVADDTLPEWDVCKEVGCTIVDHVGHDKIWSSSNYLNAYKEFIESSCTVLKPWGYYIDLYRTINLVIKLITVLPNSELSYQTHKNRSEFWHLIDGDGTVVINDSEYQLSNGDVTINNNEPHKIITSDSAVVFLEIQTGELCDEMDIVRLSDKYNRS